MIFNGVHLKKKLRSIPTFPLINRNEYFQTMQSQKNACTHTQTHSL